MKPIIQFHVTKGEQCFVATCLQLPIVTQAPTLDELAGNIEEAVALHFEGEEDVKEEYGPSPTILVSFQLPTVDHAKTEGSLRG